MIDRINDKPQPATGNQIPPHIKVLVITYDEKLKSINVSGAITDKVLCYGMMACARDVIEDYNEKLMQQNKNK
jgi:hypothetical protein